MFNKVQLVLDLLLIFHVQFLLRRRKETMSGLLSRSSESDDKRACLVSQRWADGRAGAEHWRPCGYAYVTRHTTPHGCNLFIRYVINVHKEPLLLNFLRRGTES